MLNAYKKHPFLMFVATFIIMYFVILPTSDDLTTINGSSHTMVERDADTIAPNSGMIFHTINGELYAYSSGDIRKNPKSFKLLISDLVNQFNGLVTDLNIIAKN